MATDPPVRSRIGAAAEWFRDAALALDETRRALAPSVPSLLAALVFLGGAFLLFSGTIPELPDRRIVLRDLVPLPFAEASHLSASLAGLALIVLARGLSRRIAQARIAAIALLVAGAIFDIAKALDFEAAVILLVIAAALLISRRHFYRSADWRAFRPSRAWLVIVALTVAAVTAIGLIAHSNTAYRSDLWWRFAWSGDAPRFLRASLALAVGVAVLTFDHLFNRPIPTRRAARPIPPEVRRLVADAPDSARHLALLGDKDFLLDPDGKAFLMYGVAGTSWVCLGGPVGAPAACTGLVWRFIDRVDHAGGRPVFAAISNDRLPYLLDLGHAIMKMGEVARVELAAFSLEGPGRKDLRYARGRVQRDGLRFAVVPAAGTPPIMAELRAVSDAWLATRKGREKGFSLGSFDDDYLANFDIAVMRRDDRIVAFANLMRGGRAEMSIDLMRHLPGQSPVLMDGFMTEIILHAQQEGYGWFSLGGAPLSGLPDHPRAPLWARVGTLIYRHGADYYSFEGLRAFKEKFLPVWQPIYLTCPGRMAIPRALIDLAILTTRPPPGALDDDDPATAE